MKVYNIEGQLQASHNFEFTIAVVTYIYPRSSRRSCTENHLHNILLRHSLKTSNGITFLASIYPKTGNISIGLLYLFTRESSGKGTSATPQSLAGDAAGRVYAAQSASCCIDHRDNDADNQRRLRNHEAMECPHKARRKPSATVGSVAVGQNTAAFTTPPDSSSRMNLFEEQMVIPENNMPTSLHTGTAS